MTEIIQADRDMAAAIVYVENKDGLKWASAKGMRDRVAEGKWDWYPAVQAFARHRLAERQKIVAWLRGMNQLRVTPMAIANAIEAGEYER